MATASSTGELLDERVRQTGSGSMGAASSLVVRSGAGGEIQGNGSNAGFVFGAGTGGHKPGHRNGRRSDKCMSTSWGTESDASTRSARATSARTEA